VRRPPATALAALLGLILAATAAGCGGGDSDGEPSPAERLAEAVRDYERAVADQDCAAFARFAHSEVRPPGKEPEDPPDPAECRNLGNSYTRLMGFKSTRTKIYGSAAIVEGNVDGRFVALVWTLDVDGRWVQVQTVPGIDPQIRIDFQRPGNRFAANAAAFVSAQRRGDCRTVFRLFNPASPFVARAQDPAAFCKRYREGAGDPGRLSTQLAQAPDARPRDLGGTKDLHFFRVDTGGGRRWTLIMATLPAALPAGGHAQDSVLDYYPNSR
jgi:hypothetical protein